MKRRSFFHLAWSFPALALIRPGNEPRPSREQTEPLHECVDRPQLPCPACSKWTGDPVAIKSTLPVAYRLRNFLVRRAG